MPMTRDTDLTGVIEPEAPKQTPMAMVSSNANTCLWLAVHQRLANHARVEWDAGLQPLGPRLCLESPARGLG